MTTDKPDDNILDGFQDDVSPYDAEAEPEDLAAMERALSDTTEDACPETPPDDLEEMERLGLAEPTPPDGDETDSPYDAETKPMDWREQKLLEQAYKAEQEPQGISAEQELLDLHDEWLKTHHEAESAQEDEETGNENRQGGR